MFYSISRLANTERDLYFQAMRRLYIACISWVHSFLHDRKILLAFDNEKMNHSVDFNTGISQESSVSSIL